MTMALSVIAHALALLVLPFVVVGVINRTKSLWAGRKGPPILQLAWDVLRLLRKRAVYSSTTSFSLIGIVRSVRAGSARILPVKFVRSTSSHSGTPRRCESSNAS